MTTLQLHSINCIWQQAAHNAFTDLVEFNGALWCVFREGSDHVSPDGAFRLLRSSDGLNWHSAALSSDSKADLRDAKLSVSPEGKLVLLGAGEDLLECGGHGGQAQSMQLLDDRVGQHRDLRGGWRSVEVLGAAHVLVQRRRGALLGGRARGRRGDERARPCVRYP